MVTIRSLEITSANLT